MSVCLKDNSKTLSQEQRKYPITLKRVNGLYAQFALPNFGENLLILKMAIINFVQRNAILNGKSPVRKSNIIPLIKRVIRTLTGVVALTLSIKEYGQVMKLKHGVYRYLRGINILVKIVDFMESIYTHTTRNLLQHIQNYVLI